MRLGIFSQFFNSGRFSLARLISTCHHSCLNVVMVCVSSFLNTQKSRFHWPQKCQICHRKTLALQIHCFMMRVSRKQTLRSFVVVIPKEGWACMAVPIFLWVWHWLLENMKSKDSNSKKLVSYHSSFVMTTTKTLRSVFSWRASYDAISWIWLYALALKEQNILECFTRKHVEWVPFNVLVIDVKAWEVRRFRIVMCIILSWIAILFI